MKTLFQLAIVSLAVLFASSVPATAGDYRYRGNGDEYDYYQRPRGEVVTRKVVYRDEYGRLCVRYMPVTVIPARACVTEVYEPAPAYYYSGSYSVGDGYRDSSNIRLRTPRLPDLPQPHKEIGKVHEKHQDAVVKFFKKLF